MFKGSLINSIFDSIIVEENKNAKEIIQEVVKANPLYAIKFNKEELNEFMAKMFIENVWCFGPETDLFKDSRVATLEDFF